MHEYEQMVRSMRAEDEAVWQCVGAVIGICTGRICKRLVIQG